MSTTYERLKKLVVEQLGVEEDEVKPEASFVDDLNADSLDLVELIMSLEEEFGTEISDEDAEKIRTVQDAVDYIDERSSSDRDTSREPCDPPPHSRSGWASLSATPTSSPRRSSTRAGCTSTRTTPPDTTSGWNSSATRSSTSRSPKHCSPRIPPMTKGS